jgi:zinc protease
VLDNQRGVVQNEKRQGDNQPGGLVEYEVLGNLFPAGHPYHHTTIGSMADLDAASLADVKQWFRDKYGPNNAVLVLAGDITPAEARPLVEKYFGAIPRGPVNNPAQADVPTLAAPKSIVMKDRVATDQHPALLGGAGPARQAAAALDVGGSILGGLASSRLDKDPGPRREARGRRQRRPAAVPAHRHVRGHRDGEAGRRPGGGRKRLDEIMADFIANGPTEDEVQRAAMSEVVGPIRGLEQVGGFGGKAVTLAEGQTFAGDSDFYKKTLAPMRRSRRPRCGGDAAMAEPAGAHHRLEPGDRPPYAEAKGPARPRRTSPPSPKRPMPPVGSSPRSTSRHHHTRCRTASGRLRAAQRGAGDPARAAFDAGASRRRAGRARPAA